MRPDGTPKEWPLDEGRRFLTPLFEMYDVDLVLNGHDHLYERSAKNGVDYVVTGVGVRRSTRSTPWRIDIRSRRAPRTTT